VTCTEVFGQDSFTTPPQTRKRKATARSDTSSVQSKKAKTEPKVQEETIQAPDPVLPATPITNPATPKTKMDSDDEFMSGVSSQGDEFVDDFDSDGGSLGEFDVPMIWYSVLSFEQQTSMKIRTWASLKTKKL
jgi:hypothetical protein